RSRHLAGLIAPRQCDTVLHTPPINASVDWKPIQRPFIHLRLMKMSSYLKTAISSIYSEKDDFIIIGLTGRTGSGCTTAAKKLSSDINKIRHSLFDGDNPANNEQRKQKIIIKRARKIWKRFIHIQASSIITLILLKSESKEIEELLKSQSIDEEKIKKILNEKIDLNEPTKETTLDETIKFYTETIVEKHQKIKEILGKKFIKAYQEIGKILGTPEEYQLYRLKNHRNSPRYQ